MISRKRFIQIGDFQALLDALRAANYVTVGPTIRDGAIVYDQVREVADFPAGWTDEQEKGEYRLKKREDRALFGYAVGPHSWKKYLFPPRARLWRAERQGPSFALFPEPEPKERYAFIGVRACELKAMAIQDKVFIGGEHVDPAYQSLRRNAFIVAVQCGVPAATCFCTSMGAGPEAKEDFDIALTEVASGKEHYLVAEIGTERGQEILEQVPHGDASEDQIMEAEVVVNQAAEHMGRTMDEEGVKELLQSNPGHPRWEEVAERCLSCANCTLVCPTCFCSTVEDVTDLTGDNAERWRRLDSCFTMDFSYLHGGSVRSSTKARYRQWMTHKLANWYDQFDSSGCVGCGRCITWCPVGIDITEEVKAIREDLAEKARGEMTDGKD